MKPSYKIIKDLNNCNYDKSYLAKDEKNDKKYIIRQIPLDKYNKDKEYIIVILKQLNHPNIINTKEIFFQSKPKEALNIVTEFVEGDILKEKIEKQNKVPFKESQILDYFIQICLGLQYFHKKKIIHNKIQSSNIFLTKSGIVKLGIFNLPIFKNVNITYYRMVRDISLYYIPSEELCIKSDIWSLGVLLYELMTFNFPFTAESIPLLSIKMSRGVYKPPPSIYSSEIKDLLKHLLNVHAEERPSVDEILKLPIIKNRIKTFLDEIKYNKDLYTKLENEYKEKILKIKKKNVEKEKEKKEDKKEDKNEKKNNIMNDKNKVTAFLNKKKNKNKEKKEKKENSNNPNEIISNEENLINLIEKGITDVNKMSPDHYNQLIILNTLYKIGNDLELDSDKDNIGKEKDNITIKENEIKGLEMESEKKNDDKKLEMKSE